VDGTDSESYQVVGLHASSAKLLGSTTRVSDDYEFGDDTR